MAWCNFLRAPIVLPVAFHSLFILNISASTPCFSGALVLAVHPGGFCAVDHDELDPKMGSPTGWEGRRYASAENATQ